MICNMNKYDRTFTNELSDALSRRFKWIYIGAPGPLSYSEEEGIVKGNIFDDVACILPVNPVNLKDVPKCVRYAFFNACIENKIFDAADQKGQIRRYITRMKDDEGIQIENIWVFYITGDGTKEVDPISYNYEEEDEATNIGQHFIPLAYSRDIIEWLKEDILEARIYPESLTGIVRAYVEYLEKELFSTNKNQNWEQDLKLTSKLGGLNVSNPIIKKENYISI